MEAKKLDAKLTFPVLYLESDYDIKGRALVVPIQGTGLFTANLSEYLVLFNKTGILDTTISLPSLFNSSLRYVYAKFGVIGALHNVP